jgi:hypothetical protein
MRSAAHSIPLSHSCCRYIKWTRENYPTSSSKSLEVLERATSVLKDIDELKNDIRQVQIWVEYVGSSNSAIELILSQADLLQTPGEVFSFMQANKIGTKVVVFWLAWAFVVEKLGNYSMTDKIFQKGIRMYTRKP